MFFAVTKKFRKQNVPRLDIEVVLIARTSGVGGAPLFRLHSSVAALES